jgi:hypothetical protein
MHCTTLPSGKVLESTLIFLSKLILCEYTPLKCKRSVHCTRHSVTSYFSEKRRSALNNYNIYLYMNRGVNCTPILLRLKSCKFQENILVSTELNASRSYTCARKRLQAFGSGVQGYTNIHFMVF